MIYPNIALHFGHRIPMYISIFPTRNSKSELYNNDLNSPVGMYFSAYANMPNAEKPTATKVKYKFFRLLIRSLGLTLFIFLQPLSKILFCIFSFPIGKSDRIWFAGNKRF